MLLNLMDLAESKSVRLGDDWVRPFHQGSHYHGGEVSSTWLDLECFGVDHHVLPQVVDGVGNAGMVVK